MGIGRFEPNDDGFINDHVHKAAVSISKVICVYFEGHYANSNAKAIPEEHPLVTIRNRLKEQNEQTAEFGNLVHEPSLFKIHQP
ncbi:MAG TPA: hypothetical protein DCS60_08045 [Opitutae bacterium]|nr:hypothetical protein [Opitutae bacterium]|tara:strand:- start:140 stop:391 length:252 start_codon:yes stop_codon:yes gene_type:complete